MTTSTVTFSQPSHERCCCSHARGHHNGPCKWQGCGCPRFVADAPAVPAQPWYPYPPYRPYQPWWGVGMVVNTCGGEAVTWNGPICG